MAGRPYSMKELKAIVDYLKENDAYGEVKGKKMWLDYENSKKLTRTWQSMKETFLKRILPDIHNPYYKLTPQEISSFRKGPNILYDVDVTNILLYLSEAKKYSVSSTKKVKLDVIKNDRKSKDRDLKKEQRNKNEDIHGVKAPKLNFKHDVEADKAQDISSIRDSVETVKLNTDKCYDNVEDIMRDLESSCDENKSYKYNIRTPTPKNKYKKSEVAQEPLVPVLQTILNDFSDATDCDSDSQEANIKTNNNGKKSNKKQRKTSLKDKNVEYESFDISSENTDIFQLSGVKDNVPKSKPKTRLAKKNLIMKSKEQLNTIELDEEKTELSCLTGNSTIPNNQEVLSKISVKESELISPDNIDPMLDKKDNVDTLNDINGKDNKITKSGNEELSSNGDNNNDNTTIMKSVKTTHNTIRQKEQNIEIETKQVVTIERHSCNNETQLNNPCLQNVSLFDDKMLNNQQNDKQTNKLKDVIMLPSHSESDSDNSSNAESEHSVKCIPNSKSPILSQLFGFSCEKSKDGDKNSKKNRQSKQTISRNVIPDSSDWTSGSDSDFIPPPRSRKYSRKYLRPGSSKITSLENEGGLLVTNSNKVYPIVKDSKMMRGFLKYKPSNDIFEDDELFWRKKYIEEKKRTAELAKLFDEYQNTKRRKYSQSSKPQEGPVIEIHEENEICKTNPQGSRQVNDGNDKGSQHLKFKFVSNGQEVTLEGKWETIQPILAEVKNMFQKDNAVSIPDNVKDDEIIKKVDKIEEEIFKEIKKIDESMTENPEIIIAEETGNKVPNTSNVTRRKGRPKKSTLASKKVNQEDTHVIDSEIVVSEKRLRAIEHNPRLTRRKKTITINNSPKDIQESLNSSKENSKTTPSRRAKGMLQMIGYSGVTDKTTQESKGMKIGKFAIIKKKGLVKKNLHSNKKKIVQNKNKKYCMKILRNFQNVSLDTVESMQDYRDSEGSPLNEYIRRRRKLGAPHYCYKAKYRPNCQKGYIMRGKRLQPYVHTETSNSSTDGVSISKNMCDRQSYTSKLYDINIDNCGSTDTRIYEQNTYDNTLVHQTEYEIDNLNLSPLLQAMDQTRDKVNYINNNDEMVDMETNICNSSNISISESAEISIQGQIVMPKNSNPKIYELNNMNGQLELISNTKCTYNVQNMSISNEIDPNFPLMEQEFSLVECQNTPKKNYTTTDEMSIRNCLTAKTPLSESLISKVLNEPTMSETLNDKLSNLELNSAKMFKESEGNHREKLDYIITNKYNSNNRCTTPRRQKPKIKSKALAVDSVIDECMEYCAHRRQSKRVSCPPSIVCHREDESIISKESLDITQKPMPQTRKKIKKVKKQIIKIKITRPKNKKKIVKSVNNNNNVYETESEIFLHAQNNSNEIHNHSDACLNTNDCMLDNSVMFIDNSKSIISLDSSPLIPKECIMGDIWFGNKLHGKSTSLDCFFSDAHDGISFPNEDQSISKASSKSPTINSMNSLMTEDLSNDIPTAQSQSSNWFSFDEETNVNTLTRGISTYPNPTQNFSNEYLKKLFPITCAVPDLSTITEISQDTDTQMSVKYLAGPDTT